MCGIFGIVGKQGCNPIDKERVEKAIKLLYHRGPDAQGVKIINDNVALGHTRLSIVDLSRESNQPFDYEHLSLTFNGEIFNYIELREELIAKGYCFRTKSDTEVVLAAYLQWGPNVVNRFNGMWAFAIYDRNKKELFCSRDRFGIKPFNYSFIDQEFIFSSEIKSILEYKPEQRKPNYNAIANYCRESIGAQNRETWFESIYRLAPAHNLLIKDGQLNEIRYWDYPEKIDAHQEYENAKKEYLRLFEDSVRLRMRSDVPFGATISSGLDASSIVSFIDQNYEKTLDTYTASFPNEKFDEFTTVEKLSSKLKIDAHRIIVDYEDYVVKLKKLIYHIESGHSSPAIYPLNYVCERAKKDVTVFMEGQGADEILGGYIDTVIIDYLIDLIKRWRFMKATKEALIYSKQHSLFNALILFFRINSPSWFKKIMRRGYGIESVYDQHLNDYRPYKFESKSRKFDSRLNKRLFEQHQTGLVNLLHYGDAISMRHSLENRLPFMDYKIVEFAFKLPLDFKIRNGLGKYIHRDSMKNILPDYILNNPIKIGFESPLKKLFQEDEKNGPLAILLSDRLLKRKLFKKDELGLILQKHKMGKKDYSRFLYRLLSVELWFQVFIDQKT